MNTYSQTQLTTAVDFTHTDYTDELNRIIVALTGIRNDIRLLRKTLEDPEQGVATSHVMNDIQKALMAVALSNAGAGNAEVVRKKIISGAGASLNAGAGVTSAGTSQENIAAIKNNYMIDWNCIFNFSIFFFI